MKLKKLILIQLISIFLITFVGNSTCQVSTTVQSITVTNTISKLEVHNETTEITTITTTEETTTTLKPSLPSVLCETDNDEIGKILSCSCKFTTVPPRNLLADCSHLDIGSIYHSIPVYLNVSKHVRELDFSHNNLRIINETTFGRVEGIEKLILSSNLIESVNLFNFARLLHLDLSRNVLKNLTSETFKPLTKLQTLDLSFNSLIFIEQGTFNPLQNLKELSLAHNQLSDIYEYYQDVLPVIFTEMPRLEILDLANASLPDFPYFMIDNTTNLKTLILKNNKISYIPQDALGHLNVLEHLDLSGNYFKTISAHSFIGLNGLKKLIINGVRGLEEIKAYGLSGMPTLFELSCESNHELVIIDVNAFKKDPKLNFTVDTNPRVVRLRNNNLNTIDEELLDWKSLEEIELDLNPWDCDCKLQWIPDYIKKFPSDASLLTDPYIKCAYPPPLNGVPFNELEASEMLCYSKTAGIIGGTAIAVFSIAVTIFIVIVGLSYFQILPNPFRERFQLFGASLPRYQRVVTPKPVGGMNIQNTGDPSNDLEWDNGDIQPH